MFRDKFWLSLVLMIPTLTIVVALKPQLMRRARLSR